MSTPAERPDRPIPAGLVSADTVFAIGFGLMLAGLGFILWADAVESTPTGWRPLLAGLFLAGAILFYDWNHKGNALSPFFMGLCRVLAYLVAGYAAVAAPAPGLFLVALVSLLYLIGLTYIAKQESLDRLDALLAAAVPCGAGEFTALACCIRAACPLCWPSPRSPR